MGQIVNVPGHRTDAIRENPAPKPSKKAVVENLSKVPLNVRGVVVRPKKKATIKDWQIVSGDEVVRLWIKTKALVVVSEEEVAPPEPPPPLEPSEEE